jgi:hypothetical protein
MLDSILQEIKQRPNMEIINKINHIRKFYLQYISFCTILMSYDIDYYYELTINQINITLTFYKFIF